MHLVELRELLLLCEGANVIEADALAVAVAQTPHANDRLTGDRHHAIRAVWFGLITELPAFEIARAVGAMK